MKNKLINAILKINPNAEVSCTNEDVNTIQFHNGTPEISVNDIQAKMTELEIAEANAKTQKATNQASGNQKLLDLGLSQAEATALTGYTPPSEV